MPDVAYRLSAQGPAYVPSEFRRPSLKEGETAEITLFARRTTPPLKPGDPAPPFSVKTHNGRVLNLAECRGKFVLLHFWDPGFAPGDRDVPHLQTVFKRFGKDARLVVLGLCHVVEPETATQAIERRGLAWPQVVLCDGGLEPMTMDYGARFLPATVLIGPDGTILSTGLTGAKIGEAVAAAMER
jgi:peroxiredoxin